jgi:UDP:flavonoid glycosyltransferase YjiC (YdhE family)
MIYVNLGSSGNAQLLEPLVRALADLPVTLLAATAGRCRIEDPPPNVFVADYLPGAAAAQRAQLVICNGGSASVQQALAARTPFLAIVHNLDQWLWVSVAQRCGAGVVLRGREARGDVIPSEAARMLDDGAYAAAAQRVARDFAAYDAGDAVTNLVDRITLRQP